MPSCEGYFCVERVKQDEVKACSMLAYFIAEVAGLLEMFFPKTSAFFCEDKTKIFLQQA